MSGDAGEEEAPKGVSVSDELLAHAWKVLNPEDNPKMSRADLQAYVDIFFPKQSVDLKALIKGSGLSFEKLKELVQGNELQSFDPVAEAFKVLDPAGSGYADLEVVKGMLAQMPGIGEVSDEDMKVVLELADQDLDGKISVQDFAKLSKYVPKTTKE